MKHENLLKTTFKVATGVCAAIGIVTISSIFASKAAGETVAEGMKTAKKTMDRIIFGDNNDKKVSVEAKEEENETSTVSTESENTSDTL